jgi:signal transduction histidine kinase
MSKGKLRAKIKRGATNAKQRSGSIYFLLWSAFALFSFLILMLFSVSQAYLIRNTYERETEKTLVEKGKQIETILDRTGLVALETEQFSEFINYLSSAHDVHVYIVGADGKVYSPRAGVSGDDELEFRDDFSEEMQTLLPKLNESQGKPVVYSIGLEYVYGAPIGHYQGQQTYLYVTRDLLFLKAVIQQMTVRMILIGLLVFILSFAVASAISGALVKPLTKLTEKTRRFARGDYEVDFLDGAYGEEIVELAGTLNYARDEISKADKMQKELIANVSHDFKTPLTMIKAYASMIREISGDIPEKRNKHAQVIEDEADRLTSLVSDVLDLSKIRSGLDTLKITNFDVSTYLYDVLDRFAYLVENGECKFLLDVDDGLFIQADELKIGQVMYNLIGNAVNYTGDDKRVYISLKKENGSVKFSVRDTGKGIKKEEMANIWDRYYRSGETHKRPVRGTGLGLSIVKSILEKHGFEFGVESEVGVGSTFYFKV